MPPANSYICRRLYIPNELTVVEIVNGALSELVRDFNYEPFGDLSVEDTSQMFVEMFLKYVQEDACMLGCVMAFATVTCPEGCLECDGGIYSREDYPDLYAVLHAELIIDADSFRTPNLISKFVMGASGDFGVQPAHENIGSAEVTLTVDNLAEHDHSTLPHSHTTLPHAHAEGIAVPTVINGGVSAPAPAATPSISTTSAETVLVNDATVTVSTTGASEPFSIIPPAYTLRYCIVAR